LKQHIFITVYESLALFDVIDERVFKQHIFITVYERLVPFDVLDEHFFKEHICITIYERLVLFDVLDEHFFKHVTTLARKLLLDEVFELHEAVKFASKPKSSHFHHFLTLILRICSTLTFAAWSEEPTALLPIIFFWASKGSYTPIHCNARTHMIAWELNC